MVDKMTNDKLSVITFCQSDKHRRQMTSSISITDNFILYSNSHFADGTICRPSLANFG